MRLKRDAKNPKSVQKIYAKMEEFANRQELKPHTPVLYQIGFNDGSL